MNIIISILAVGILIALHELGHMTAARAMGMKVIRYSVGFFKPLAQWTSKKSGITYQLGALPLGGFVQIAGMNPFEEGANTDPDSYLNKPVWRRAIVLSAGPVANLLIAWIILFGLFITSGNPQYVDESGIGFVAPGGPADEAGLKDGDEIKSVNGESVTTWKGLVRHIEANPDKDIVLEVAREESRFLVTLAPKNVDGVGKLGIGQPQTTVSLPVHTAALATTLKCYEVVRNALVSLGSLVTGQSSDVEAVGPPGIIRMAARALESGLVSFLALMSYLSLMLFLFNFLPLPALDGGRAVFLLYEAIVRRPVSPKFDVVVNSVGFFLLIGLLLFMSIRDFIPD